MCLTIFLVMQPETQLAPRKAKAWALNLLQCQSCLKFSVPLVSVMKQFWQLEPFFSFNLSHCSAYALLLLKLSWMFTLFWWLRLLENFHQITSFIFYAYCLCCFLLFSLRGLWGFQWYYHICLILQNTDCLRKLYFYLRWWMRNVNIRLHPTFSIQTLEKSEKLLIIYNWLIIVIEG